jgi:circadian clock protein KaiC
LQAIETLPVARQRVPTGIRGLDEILQGGLPADQLFLLEGAPGTGKTTLALQFLLEGARRGERCLYVTLAETAREVRHVANSHGWSLDGIDILELAPPDEVLKPEMQYTVFHPSDVELGQTMRRIYDEIDERKPARLVVDSVSEMRILAQDPLRLRRQMLALKHFFTGRECTVMVLDDVRSDNADLQFGSIAHGVIQLEQIALEYGAERRRLRVLKMRGQWYRGGLHDFVIRTGGLIVFPRLVSATHEMLPVGRYVSSGNPQVDLLLGGGLDDGTATLLTGPAGVGKSVLCTQYALAAARRGERVAVYLFDERHRTFMARAAGLGMDLGPEIDAGRIIVRQIDPADVSPGEFAHLVMDAVEEEGVRMVIIDSLTGYMNAMPEEKLLRIHLHELFTYLTIRGVTALLTLAQAGPFEANGGETAQISYLADSILLLRYFEASGEVRQAVSVLKKRSGNHEHTIREFRIDQGGYHVGDPLRAFQGVLTGVPEYVGAATRLEPGRDGGRVPA